MLAKKLYVVLIVFFVSIAVIFSLYATSNPTSHSRHHFTRIFKDSIIAGSRCLDLRCSSFYIAGTSTSRIYLANINDPLKLLTATVNLSDIQYKQINISPSEKMLLRAPTVFIDTPLFYFDDGAMPGIFCGALTDWNLQRITNDSLHFTASVPISSHSFILRTVDQQQHINVLAKETIDSPYRRLYAGLLKKQVDGLFCTDGMLVYDHTFNSIVYVYYYRNQFICLDTNMNLKYSGNTIDDIVKADIQTAAINHDKTFVLSKPALQVNKKACVMSGQLLINSNILSENESRQAFLSSSVIDIYDLQNGKYKFSIHIFIGANKKIQSMKASANKLIITADHFIYAYDLKAEYF